MERYFNEVRYFEDGKQKRISENIPKWTARPFKEFAGVKGFKIHEDFKNGSLEYCRFVLQKTYVRK